MATEAEQFKLLELIEESESAGNFKRTEELKAQLVKMMADRKAPAQAPANTAGPSIKPLTGKHLERYNINQKTPEIDIRKRRHPDKQVSQNPTLDLLGKATSAIPWPVPEGHFQNKPFSEIEPGVPFTGIEWVSHDAEYKAKEAARRKELSIKAEKAMGFRTEEPKGSKKPKEPQEPFELPEEPAIFDGPEGQGEDLIRAEYMVNTQGVDTIPLSDGTAQKLPKAYPYAGAFQDLIADANKRNIKIAANAEHGAFREDPAQRYIDNPKTYSHVFKNPAGPYTKENIKESELAKLYKSSHNLDAAGQGAPIAIDVYMNLHKESKALEAQGKGRGLTPDGLPTNEAFNNSEIGEYFNENTNYNLLKHGWVPIGYDKQWYDLYGEAEGLPKGIHHGHGRFEHWHIEYRPDEAKRRLIKLNYMDPETGMLIPPASSFGPDGKMKDGIIVGDGKTGGDRVISNDDYLSLAKKNYRSKSKVDDPIGSIQANLDVLNKNTAARDKLRPEMERSVLLHAAEQQKQEKLNLESRKKLAAFDVETALAKAAYLGEVDKDLNTLEESYRKKSTESLKAIKSASDWMKANRPDPYRQFAWLNKDGNVTTGKFLYTLGAAIALVANAVVTVKTAMKKKGRTVPFMAWDMIMQAMNLDIRAQESAMAGAQAEMNAEISYLGKLSSVSDNKRANILELKKAYLEHSKAKVEVAKKEWGAKGKEDIAAQYDALSKKHDAEIQSLNYQLKNEVINKNREELGAKVSGLSVIGSQQAKALDQVMSAEIAMANQNVRKGNARELTAKERESQQAAFNAVITLKEVQGLWDTVGKANPFFKWLNSKGAFHLINFDGVTREGEKLRTLREQLAAQWARMQGNVGNLTKIEQARGMMAIPLKDSDELGIWKIERGMTRARLNAISKWYLLSDSAREQIMTRYVNFPNTPQGVRDQVQYLNNIIRDLGGDQFTRGKLTAKELSSGFKTTAPASKEQVAQEIIKGSEPVNQKTLPGKKI